MIQSKSDLKYCIKEDLKRFEGRLPTLKDWILCNESWYIWHYIRHLRYIEYHKNKKGWHKLAFLYHWYKYKHLGSVLDFTIYPNTVAPGLRIYHKGGFVHVGPNVRIGRNCTMQPGVVFGNKHEKSDNVPIVVGDNCYFGLGAKIFGSVTIGNNVTVGANAVVTKDIPDNVVVGGIPAQIIRYKQEK